MPRVFCRICAVQTEAGINADNVLMNVVQSCVPTHDIKLDPDEKSSLNSVPPANLQRALENHGMTKEEIDFVVKNKTLDPDFDCEGKWKSDRWESLQNNVKKELNDQLYHADQIKAFNKFIEYTSSCITKAKSEEAEKARRRLEERLRQISITSPEPVQTRDGAIAASSSKMKPWMKKCIADDFSAVTEIPVTENDIERGEEYYMPIYETKSKDWRKHCIHVRNTISQIKKNNVSLDGLNKEWATKWATQCCSKKYDENEWEQGYLHDITKTPNTAPVFLLPVSLMR